MGEFFSRYTYDEPTKKLNHQQGRIQAGKDTSIHVHLTRALDQDEWGRLLTECQQHGVSLHVSCAPAVELPPALQKEYSKQSTLKSDWDKSATSPTKIIESTDADTTLALIQKTKKPSGWSLMFPNAKLLIYYSDLMQNSMSKNCVLNLINRHRRYLKAYAKEKTSFSKGNYSPLYATACRTVVNELYLEKN
ncbi:MAG: hypothetical protein ACRCXC_06505 [Legionella sp.]